MPPSARCPSRHTGEVTPALISLVAVLLLLVGLVGTVYPVLPGSLLNLVTALGWAALLGSPASWTFGVIAAGLAVAGLSASAVLTGRRLRRERVTRGPILWGVAGAAVGIADRLELSYQHQWFDTGGAGARLGLGRGYTFEQDVFGAKLRLFEEHLRPDGVAVLATA